MTNHGLEGLLERLSVVVFRTGTKTGKKETRDAGEVHLGDHDSRHTLPAGVKESWRPPQFCRPDLSARSGAYSACRGVDSLQFLKKKDCSLSADSVG